MSLLFNALSGAQAAQAALATTSQNIANVMTPGYSRQGVVLASVGGNASNVSASGGGVTVATLQRYSDSFKNLQMWSAASNLGKADASQPYLDQLEQVMSDDTSNVNAGLDQFFAALNAASVEPDSSPLRAQVITAADGLAKRFGSLQQLLQNQASAVSAQRQAIVTQINTLNSDIAELNKQISANQAIGLNPAALQDTRDQRIDALASLVGIQVVDQPDGTRNVSLKSGQPLVVGGDAAQLAVNALVGGSHSLSLKFANTSFTVQGTDFGGQLGGLESFEGAVLAPMQQTVREMASGIANAFNAQLAQGVDTTQTPLATGTGKPLFVDPATNGGQLQLTGISADELAFSLDPAAAGDSQNLTKLIALQGKPITLTNFDAKGQPLPTSSQVVLGDAYTQLIGKLGVASQQNIASQKTAQTVRDQAEESWKSTSGVNEDEEAVNLVQYQQMYQANMKVLAVANELFDSTLQIL
ncbi:flagellar hook-associated protein FlgK [Pelomonas sp. KK5]|uniref:flagellar hook-associated protein FlgK n=1 Tax=Pelomonas sp. KK5 TaxID=1855730 RepID=UPI00097C585A|nr:flagellar hook-associated protein FlgK [Pelomonas sp. KK5]